MNTDDKLIPPHYKLQKKHFIRRGNVVGGLLEVRTYCGHQWFGLKAKINTVAHREDVTCGRCKKALGKWYTTSV